MQINYFPTEHTLFEIQLDFSRPKRLKGLTSEVIKDNKELITESANT